VDVAVTLFQVSVEFHGRGERRALAWSRISGATSGRLAFHPYAQGTIQTLSERIISLVLFLEFLRFCCSRLFAHYFERPHASELACRIACEGRYMRHFPLSEPAGIAWHAHLTVNNAEGGSHD